MDFLNKAISQVADLFRSMTPGARITAGLLLGLLVVSLVWLVGQKGSGPDDYLLGGQQFSSGEVNAMEQAFGKAGLDGYTLEGNRIRVPRGQRAAFMGAIADAGALPSDFGAALRKTLAEGGPFITTREREERLKVALQEELALWIRSMPGIEKAAVAYDVKKTGGLKNETLATASVSVKAVGNIPLDESRVRGIGHMVASAISELKPENVVVTDLVSGQSHRLSGDGVGGDNSLFELRKKYEEDFSRLVKNALGYVPGAQIAINVELDTEARRQVKTLEFDKVNSATVHSEETTQDESRDTAGPGGVPGARSNTSASANTGQTVSTTPGNSSTLAKSSASQTIAPGGMQSTSEHLGLQPKRVTASISVPKSYFVRLWRERNGIDESQKVDENQVAAIETARIQEMRQLIAGLLPVSDPQDPMKPGTIMAFDDFPPAELPEPSVATGVLAWLGSYWSTLGMVFLGMFALLMLRSTVRGAAASVAEPDTSTALPATIPFPTASEPDKEEAAKDKEAKKPAARILKRREPGVSLKDELTELIREDPDGAAAILRSWIGSAG